MSRLEKLLIAALALAWIPGVLRLAEVWSEVEYASHGFLVPFVSLWIAASSRVALATAPRAPLAGGLLWIGVAAFGYLLALASGDDTLLGLSLIATVVLTVLGLRGPASLRVLAFPVGYLLFLVPLPTAWVTPVIFQLQLWVSSSAVWLLQQAGVAIYREGNVLTLPGDQSLFVAEACSGITSLITLLPIGVLIATFSEARLLRRLVLVAAVVPFALLGNLLRVMLTVWLAMTGDVELATEGPLHEWAGVGTYVLGCGGLLAVGAAMRRFWPEREPESIA